MDLSLSFLFLYHAPLELQLVYIFMLCYSLNYYFYNKKYLVHKKIFDIIIKFDSTTRLKIFQSNSLLSLESFLSLYLPYI
jgi:hypothetical protein